MSLSVLCFRYLKSTAGNIQLINSVRNTDYDSSEKPEERLFGFWMEFFIESSKKDFTSTQFPVGHIIVMQLFFFCSVM